MNNMKIDIDLIVEKKVKQELNKIIYDELKTLKYRLAQYQKSITSFEGLLQRNKTLRNDLRQEYHFLKGCLNHDFELFYEKLEKKVKVKIE